MKQILSEIRIKIFYRDGILEFIFYCLVFILAFQTRIFYFTNDSYFNNVYVFYNTLLVYLTDILLILLVFLWILGIALGLFHVKQLLTRFQVAYLFVLFFIAVFSVSVSQETNLIQYFGLFKLFLLIIFFCFIINIIVKHLFHKIFWLILANSIFQVLLAIYQYFSQKSLGLRVLGEEFLRNYLPGIASFYSVWGQRWIFDKILNVYRETIVIRPYGTFPHPNVYGAFLFVSLIVSYYLFLVSRETWKKIVIGFVIFLQVFGLFMSFSRVAIVSWALGTGLFFLLLFVMKQKELFYVKPLLLVILASTAICSTIFYQQLLERGGVVSRGTTNQTAVSDRILYQKTAWEMIKKNPLAGVGYQNFVLQMDKYTPVPLKDYQHQPVHNLYLLVAAETGIFGLLFFVLFISSIIWSVFKSPWDVAKAALVSIFLGFLFIGLFDHYLLTIQQGRLIFFIVAGLLVVAAQDVAAKSESSSRSSEIETKIIQDTA